MRRNAQLAIDFTSNKTKHIYNSKHKAIEFAVNDKIYLKLHHGYHLPSKPSRKYSQQKAGPWPVKRQVGRLAYEINLPPTFKIHPIISITHLSAKGNGKENPFRRTTSPPGPIKAEQNADANKSQSDIYKTEIITQHRLNRTKKNFDYLVK